jgi:hypothetical protein
MQHFIMYVQGCVEGGDESSLSSTMGPKMTASFSS